MKLQKNIWIQCLNLEKEFIKRGEKISRNKLQDAFNINQNLAQKIIFALENKNVIRLQNDTYFATNNKCITIADLHIPFHDQLAIDTVFEFADEYNPDIIVILGDLIDFYKVSRFIKNPLKKDIDIEIKETKKFLTDLRSRYKNAKIIYKQGNHEARLESYIMSNAREIYNLISDLLQIKLGLGDLKIDYQIEPFKVGKLNFLHGHEKPGGSYNPEYITNVIWKYINSHFIVAHFHRSQEKIFKNIDNEFFWGGAVGYLAGAMEYAMLNNWSQGFGKICFNENGNFRAELKTVVDGKIY